MCNTDTAQTRGRQRKREKHSTPSLHHVSPRFTTCHHDSTRVTSLHHATPNHTPSTITKPYLTPSSSIPSLPLLHNSFIPPTYLAVGMSGCPCLERYLAWIWRMLPATWFQLVRAKSALTDMLQKVLRGPERMDCRIVADTSLGGPWFGAATSFLNSANRALPYTATSQDVNTL